MNAKKITMESTQLHPNYATQIAEVIRSNLTPKYMAQRIVDFHENDIAQAMGELVTMVLSSLSGTTVPLLFQKLKVDPAVASGPLITTINDLVAVVTYYGLAWILLIRFLNLA